MEFRAPAKEQLFALRHFAKIEELADCERFSDADSDVVEALIYGIGDFAEGEFAPLNQLGDREGARLENGRVVMPDGYKEAYRAFVENGWNAISSPEEFGGQAMPAVLGAAVLETLGAANMAFTLCPILSFGAIEALIAHGSEEQKSLFLPKLVSGEWTGTMNLTEPHAGSDVGALTTTAIPKDDGTWSITGQKIYITFGDHELTENIIHLVLARTPDAPPGSKGISLFLVPKYRVGEDGEIGQENGIETVALERKMGIHVSPTCVLQYGGKGESIGTLIGREHGGLAAMFTMMNHARLNVGLQGVQIAERATQQARAYAAERIQSARAGAAGREPVAIIEHPDVRRMLFRMEAQTDAMRALLYHVFGQLDRSTVGIDGARAMVELLTPIAKSHATDVGCEVASIGVQVHGGAGFVEDTGAAQYYRDARIAPIYEGTNGIQAADLVMRKIGMEGGAVVRDLLSQIASDAKDEPELALLVADCVEVVDWMLGVASVDDRLAGSSPFLDMMGITVCGWLMLRQVGIASEAAGDAFLARRHAFARYYLDQIVPEGRSLKAAAMAGAGALYSLTTEELAATA